MPRPKTISDEQILAIARRCFRERGHSVSTRDIAKAVGISQSVLYQRFGGKEAMFLRAMMPEPPDVDALLDRPAGSSARAYVGVMVHRLVEHFQTLVPALMHLTTYPNFDISLEGAHDHLLAARLHEALARRFEAMTLANEIAPHTAESLAATVIALAHTAGMHASLSVAPVRPDEPAPAELRSDSESLDAMVDVIWQGMSPRHPG